MRVRRHVLLVLTVLGVWASAACTPEEADQVVAVLAASGTTTTTAAPAPTGPACCTDDQARYIAQREAEQRVRDRFAGHPLRPIAGCESSREHRKWAEPVWDRYYHDQPDSSVSTASGGLQMLDGTFRTWVARYLPEYQGRWARAAHAPDWFQMELGMRAYDDTGTTPWRSSSGCWAQPT